METLKQLLELLLQQQLEERVRKKKDELKH